MPYKPTNRLPNILSSLLKPLLFASKDDFARLDTVKGLEGLVSSLCNEAISLCLTERQTEKILELRGLFKGFDILDLEDKKERILRARGIVMSLREQFPLTPSLSHRGERGNDAKPSGEATGSGGIASP